MRALACISKDCLCDERSIAEIEKLEIKKLEKKNSSEMNNRWDHNFWIVGRLRYLSSTVPLDNRSMGYHQSRPASIEKTAARRAHLSCTCKSQYLGSMGPGPAKPDYWSGLARHWWIIVFERLELAWNFVGTAVWWVVSDMLVLRVQLVSSLAAVPGLLMLTRLTSVRSVPFLCWCSHAKWQWSAVSSRLNSIIQGVACIPKYPQDV